MTYEDKILYFYLKYGLSTRQLDEKIGHDSNKSKGWASQKILKKYFLEITDKALAFTTSDRELKIIIKNIKNASNRNNLLSIFNNINPQKLEKYRNVYLLAENEEALYQVM